jgi:hypothetical protein
MKKFLLLRSNKQSGPYSAEELQQMGLKAYDLIWVNGKSAAWRYPGEIDELKAFAPAVEEQPYDRFYKKSTEAETPAAQAQAQTPVAAQPQSQQQSQQQSQPPTPPAIQQPQPAEKPARKEKEYKRVFVTLPSGSQQKQPIAKPAETTTDLSAHSQYLPPVQQPAAATNKPEAESTTPPVTPTGDLTEKELYERKVAAAKAATAMNGFSNEKSSSGKKAVSETGNDVYFPKKRSRLRGVPLAAMIIGMIAMTALGIVIGMSLNGNKGFSLIKRTDPVTPANDETKEPATTTQPQRTNNEAALNQTSAEIFADSISTAQAKKLPVKIVPAVKKNTGATDSNEQNIAANLPVKEEPLNKEEATVKKELPKPSAPDLEKLVSVSNNDFEVGPFGGISRLALTVKNASEYPLNLVVVQVDYLKANKEVYKTENLYFRDVAANSTLTVDAPRSSRGNKINYKITLINSRDLLVHSEN